jgi:hypothetical protein
MQIQGTTSSPAKSLEEVTSSQWATPQSCQAFKKQNVIQTEPLLRIIIRQLPQSSTTTLLGMQQHLPCQKAQL